MNEKGAGIWIPEGVFKIWESLRLDSSVWNVLMVIANQQYRYGGDKAYITLPVIAKRTKLSLSTIKRSVSKLQNEELLVKIGRGHWQLIGVNMMTPIRPPREKCKGVNMMTPSRGHDHEPFSNLLLSIINNKYNNDTTAPFTAKQINTLSSVLCQLSELLCDDPMALIVSGSKNDVVKMTYENWLKTIVNTQDRKEAGLFVRAILKLLKDERIVGREIEQEAVTT